MWWSLLVLACSSPDDEPPVSLDFPGVQSVALTRDDGLQVQWLVAGGSVDRYEVVVADATGERQRVVAEAGTQSLRLDVADEAVEVEVWVEAVAGAVVDPGEGPLSLWLGRERLQLLGQYPIDGLGDVHGDGDLLVAAGRVSGSSFFVFDIADPTQPRLLADVQGEGFVKDVKVHEGRLYTQGECEECGGDEAKQAAYDGIGVRLFDLADPAAPRRLGTLQGEGFGEPYFSVHNLTWSADHLYLSDNGLDAMPIVDVSDPTRPVEVARYTPPEGNVHDQTVVGDRAYVAWWRGFAVLDVTDPASPVVLAEHSDPELLAVHNVWPTADGNHLLVSSEVPTGHMTVFDISDLDAIHYVGDFGPYPFDVIHNIVVQGDYAFVSWYEQGLVVVDLLDPSQPEQVAQFDTLAHVPEGHTYEEPWPLFAGAWGVWPRDDGLVAVGDMQNGLFLFRFLPVRVSR